MKNLWNYLKPKREESPDMSITSDNLKKSDESAERVLSEIEQSKGRNRWTTLDVVIKDKLIEPGAIIAVPVGKGRSPIKIREGVGEFQARIRENGFSNFIVVPNTTTEDVVIYNPGEELTQEIREWMRTERIRLDEQKDTWEKNTKEGELFIVVDVQEKNMGYPTTIGLQPFSSNSHSNNILGPWIIRQYKDEWEAAGKPNPIPQDFIDRLVVEKKLSLTYRVQRFERTDDGTLLNTFQ